MGKKREILKVDEDGLKEMMGSEWIWCGKCGGDVGENVVGVREKEKNVVEVKREGEEKWGKRIGGEGGVEEKVEM